MFERPSNEIARRIEERLPGIQTSGKTGKAIAKIVNDTGLAILGTQAGARLVAEAMQQTSNLVDLARDLSGDDPVKAALLIEQVRSYARRSSQASQSILGW